MVERMIRHVFSLHNYDYSYCEFYNCCKSIPCRCGRLLQKNHDFNLDNPLLDNGVYVVLFRHDLIEQADAIHRFHSSHRSGDYHHIIKPDPEWWRSDKYRDQVLARIEKVRGNHAKFIKKWAAGHDTRILAIDYAEILKDPKKSLGNILGHLFSHLSFGEAQIDRAVETENPRPMNMMPASFHQKITNILVERANEEKKSGATTSELTQIPLHRHFPRPDHETLVFPVVQNLNNHKQVPGMEEISERAGVFWSVAEAMRDAREENLAKILKDRNRKKTVLVMTLNRGFTDLLLNWIKSCDMNGIEVRSWTLIVAMDKYTASIIEAEGFAVYCDEQSYGDQQEEAAGAYGDRIFAHMMFPKTLVVQDLLNLGFDVLFQDVDIVWKKDPLELLLRDDRKYLDAQFMYDGPNIFYAPFHANSGFFFLRNTQPCREFWTMVYENFDKMLYMRSQQRVINHILLGRYFRGLQLDILAEKDIANGHLFNSEEMNRLPPDPYVIHVSWTKNIAHKMKKYKLAGLWYL
jgi:hypothetical protein